MEILSPIKSLENAKIAIKKGANALYLASPNFGARVNASIEDKEIKQIIKIAKSNDVKTFITFNIVIFDNELDKFFSELDRIYLYGATGIIIQDFSLIKIIKKRYPNLEVHASTQMNIHNTNAVNIVKELGVNQVVVPREMSFNKIHKLKLNTNIKLESFVHGALCVSYSGQCYDSTLLDQKSANRGRCSQYCRMPSKVYNKRTNRTLNKGEYSLNLKDLSSINQLDKYEKSGVDVLKIEGRLKGIDYVGLVTETYKKKLENKDVDHNILKEVYNRTFSTGLINLEQSSNLVNNNRPNNNGVYIGEVKKCIVNNNNKLKYYKYKIFIQTNKTINLGDNLRFLSKKEAGQIVEKIEKQDNCIVLYSNIKVDNKIEIFRTKNSLLISKYKKEIDDIKLKREEIKTSIKILKKEIIINICLNDYKLDIDVYDAIKHELTKNDVYEIMLKTKNTDYDIKILDIEIEKGIFLPNKSLKKIRDLIIDTYKDNNKKRIINDFKLPIYKKNIKVNKVEKNFYFSLKTKEHLEYFLQKEIKINIKILLSFNLVENLFDLDLNYKIRELKSKYDVYLVLPRVLYDDKEESIINIINCFDNLCISEVGSLKYKNLIKGEVISNFSLNTTNIINQKFLKDFGVKKQMLSIELNNNKIEEFDKKDSIINIYGAIPVMIMDYCPINSNKVVSCGECKRCRSNNYAIVDNLNRSFPLIYEGDSKIGLYSEDKLSLFEEMEELNDFSNFSINLTDEKEEEIDKVIKSIGIKKSFKDKPFKGNYYKEVL